MADLNGVTPTRKHLRGIIQKRIEMADDGHKIHESTLDHIADTVSSSFLSLKARILYAQTDSNYVEPLLEVSRKTKQYDGNVEPHDPIRIVFNSKLMFKVYVYLELVEEGRLTDPHDVANLLVLKQMNSKMSFVCVGVSNYSAFQQSLGYTPKTVIMFHCLLTLQDTQNALGFVREQVPVNPKIIVAITVYL